MIRLGFAISLCVGMGLWQGLPGLGLAWLILAVLGLCMPARRREEGMPSETDDKMWEKVETARKGSSIDPTRPDDHPLLLTNEIRRRR